MAKGKKGGEEVKNRERFFVAFCTVTLIILSVFAILRDRGIIGNNKLKTEETSAKSTESEASKTNKEDASLVKNRDELKKTKPATTIKSDYSYTAECGDSYTIMARRAIASYAETNDIVLSASQKLLAEVELTNQAGAPQLEIGQVVTIDYNTVAAIVQPKDFTTAVRTEEKEPKTKEKDDKVSTNYNFVTTSGDSYTALARRAITNYTKTNNLELSPVQRVAAETILTTQAGSPRLDIKESVTIQLADIRSVVVAVQDYSTTKLTAWQPYANQVVFNE